ncbi:MAG: outer membrane beta-barrel protein [Bacteroidota bacterium]
MTRSTMLVVWSILSLGLALFLPLRSARAENTRHHITLGLGYQKYLGRDLKSDEVGVDFTNAAWGSVSYRFSVRPNLDLTLDTRGAVSTDQLNGVDLTLTNSYFGPGIRLVGANEGTRPYIQANIYTVDEEIELAENGSKVSVSKSAVGFGVCGGVDIRASRLLSIPIEVGYTYSKPADTLRGLGGTVGLTFNFGRFH